MKKTVILFVLLILFNTLPGCRVIITEDNYSLDRIDGDITCEYRVGKDAMWSEHCVDTDISFDKNMFLKLFHEYNSYDPRVIKKNPGQCDLKIIPDTQPEEWQILNNSEFNVRAVFGDEQRNVSIYRYNDNLYYLVLWMGERSEPEKEGVYFMKLSEEMHDYWQGIIDAVIPYVDRYEEAPSDT